MQAGSKQRLELIKRGLTIRGELRVAAAGAAMA
jgi:hypothetical protein